MSEANQSFQLNLGGNVAAVSAVNQELDYLREDFSDLGYALPEDIAAPEFFAVIGQPFVPNEIPPVQFLNRLTPDWQKYFGTVVQPQLREKIEDNNPEVISLGMQVGRVIASNGMHGPLLRQRPPIEIGKAEVAVDEQRVPHTIPEGGIVIDYGMGINGLFSHIENVQDRRYRVYAIQRGIGEVALLNGMLDYHEISQEELQVEAGGIGDRVANLLQGGAAGMSHMIVASRVHMAGEDLREGIRAASGLLQSGGLLIARGPRKLPSEVEFLVGYDEVHDMIAADKSLTIEPQSYTFATFSSHDELEPNRLIVARRQ